MSPAGQLTETIGPDAAASNEETKEWDFSKVVFTECQEEEYCAMLDSEFAMKYKEYASKTIAMIGNKSERQIISQINKLSTFTYLFRLVVLILLTLTAVDSPSPNLFDR